MEGIKQNLLMIRSALRSGTAILEGAEKAGVEKNSENSQPKRESPIPDSLSVPKAYEIAAEGSPLDEGAVEKIKSEMASGRYDIDPKRIADSMLNWHKEFNE